MDKARSEWLLLVADDDPAGWREAQEAIERGRGFQEALIERQLQDLDESVVGTSAAELAQLRDGPRRQ